MENNDRREALVSEIQEVLKNHGFESLRVELPDTFKKENEKITESGNNTIKEDTVKVSDMYDAYCGDKCEIQSKDQVAEPTIVELGEVITTPSNVQVEKTYDAYDGDKCEKEQKEVVSSPIIEDLMPVAKSEKTTKLDDFFPTYKKVSTKFGDLYVTEWPKNEIVNVVAPSDDDIKKGEMFKMGSKDVNAKSLHPEVVNQIIKESNESVDSTKKDAIDKPEDKKILVNEKVAVKGLTNESIEYAKNIIGAVDTGKPSISFSNDKVDLGCISKKDFASCVNGLMRDIENEGLVEPIKKSKTNNDPKIRFRKTVAKSQYKLWKLIDESVSNDELKQSVFEELVSQAMEINAEYEKREDKVSNLFGF